jgi:hypothetical protein
MSYVFGKVIHKAHILVYYEGHDIRDFDGREPHSPLMKGYLDFSLLAASYRPRIDQAWTPCHPEREMELQTASFDVEKLLNVHHLRALLHRSSPSVWPEMA